MFVTSWSVCPWRAFPAWSNVCGDYLRVKHLSRAPLQGRLLALLANSRLVLEGKPGTNTLAYHEHHVCKKFYDIGHRSLLQYTRKYKTRVEVPRSDKRYILLQYGINYGRKKFCENGLLLQVERNEQKVTETFLGDIVITVHVASHVLHCHCNKYLRY